MSNGLWVLGAAAAYLTMPMWGRAARAKGVPVPAHVTAAQTAAASTLPLLYGKTEANLDKRAKVEVTIWPTETLRALTQTLGQGHNLPSGISQIWEMWAAAASADQNFGPATFIPKWNAAEYQRVLGAMLEAVEEGVRAGYRVSAWRPHGAGVEWEVGAWSKVRQGQRPTWYDAGGAGVPFGDKKVLELNSLGEAVIAAVQEAGVWHASGALGSDLGAFGDQLGTSSFSDRQRATRALARLAVEMDGQGYLIFGLPEPDPRVLDGLAYAADKSAEAAAKVAIGVGGSVVGGVGGALLGSRLFWLGAFGFLAWRVLR